MVTLRDIVLHVRASLNLRQWQLAAALKVGQSTVAGWEMGTHGLSGVHLIRLRNFLASQNLTMHLVNLNNYDEQIRCAKRDGKKARSERVPK